MSQQSTIIVQIQPLQALSVYQVNGTKDPTIPLEGGESGVGHEFVSAKESAKNWSNHFNCSINPLIKVDTWGSFAVTSYTYSDCTRKHKVSYHLVQAFKFWSIVDVFDDLFFHGIRTLLYKD